MGTGVRGEGQNERLFVLEFGGRGTLGLWVRVRMKVVFTTKNPHSRYADLFFGIAIVLQKKIQEAKKNEKKWIYYSKFANLQ